MWSLVNTPTLAFDAGRLPAGAAFAADLLGALALDASTLTVLDVLAGELPPLGPQGREPETVLTALSDVRAALADPTGAGVPAGTAARLARAPFTGRAGIADFVRDDVLSWTHYRDGARSGRRWSAGGQLVSEVVAASHAGDLAEHPRRSTWARLRPAPHAPTGLPGMEERLAHLAAALTPAALVALDDYARRTGRTRDAAGESWPELVHAATQVLFVTDRLRSAAIAQLRAALVLRTVHPAPAPLDAICAVSGAVHAWATRDLLDDDRYAALVAPVEAVLGAS